MNVRERLAKGLVIPAHPLALTSARKLDERRQRALTRYYLAAGAGGIAVGVHTTQFAIRDPKIGLYEPVLALAMEEATKANVVKIAGVCGPRHQAVKEAELARSLGYDAVLLSMGGLNDLGTDKLVEHARAIAGVMPVVGFYLQPSVGGRLLPYEFWREFAKIENVVAIKMAPFNRYQTIDVLRGVIDSGRARDISLYTGNDDSILIDLLTRWNFGGDTLRIVGGLLGHWAVWTSKAAEHLALAHRSGAEIPIELLTLAHQITDANAAFFDAAHGFAGCIAGIHEVLRRQGLLEGVWCLREDESLSPGQSAEIDRVYAAYPHLSDDSFVQSHLDGWMR
ncbi:MAG TPA: dihydrodipicolinate synthase family protein [Acidobacteriaceae bacterium]|nr:dihydrodipicolinate synthase family protein [Acidobacteriaceae bacterium]